MRYRWVLPYRRDDRGQIGGGVADQSTREVAGERAVELGGRALESQRVSTRAVYQSQHALFIRHPVIRKPDFYITWPHAQRGFDYYLDWETMELVRKDWETIQRRAVQRVVAGQV